MSSVIKLPSTAVNDSTVGTVDWADINYICSEDENAASFTAAINEVATRTSRYAKATNFGFTIPTGSVINGIVFDIKCMKSVSNGSAVFNSVKLVKDGSIVGEEKYVSQSIPSSFSTVNFGASNDTWGVSLTAEDVNSSNFGAVFSVTGSTTTTSSLSMTIVEVVKITVYYTEPAKTMTGVTSVQGIQTITL